MPDEAQLQRIAAVLRDEFGGLYDEPRDFLDAARRVQEALGGPSATSDELALEVRRGPAG